MRSTSITRADLEARYRAHIAPEVSDEMASTFSDLVDEQVADQVDFLLTRPLDECSTTYVREMARRFGLHDDPLRLDLDDGRALIRAVREAVV